MSTTESEAVDSAPIESTSAESDEVASEQVDPATDETDAGETETDERNRRKVREGIVTSVAMEKTAVVAVTERVRHSRYFKTVQRTKKLYAHDAAAQARPGDRVRVMETRPISKTKRWRLIEIVERAR